MHRDVRPGAISSRCNDRNPVSNDRCSKKQRHDGDHEDYFGKAWKNTIDRSEVAPETDRAYLPD